MKVYCSNCKHFDKYEGCLHPKHMVDTPYSRKGGNIHEINAGNSCAEYEKGTPANLNKFFWVINALGFVAALIVWGRLLLL